MASIAPLPRGIQLVSWKNKDKSVSLRYRVRISRKDGLTGTVFKQDELFDELSQAKEFLALSKSRKGRNVINQLTDEEANAAIKIKEYLASPGLSFYIDSYERKLIDSKNGEEEDELKRRNLANMKSFFKTIKNTEISIDAHSGMMAFDLHPHQTRAKFGELKLEAITYIEINHYIEERLKAGRKKSSVSREVSIISKIFQKLKHEHIRFKEFKNPVLDYDKELLKGQPRKPKSRTSKEDFKKFFEVIENYENKDMRKICLFALATGMRRSEVLTLQAGMVFENFVQLKKTKSGNPRKVYLTTEAKQILDEVAPTKPNERLFKGYSTIAGFEGSYSKMLENAGLKHLSFHVLRKEAISHFIEKIGRKNSLLITEILGIQGMRAFKRNHLDNKENSLETQEEALESFGHSSEQTTKNFYFSL
ncbi:MAG: site-specific integrase [Polaromonas sp.]|nr:site-specific integrase [Polaromonas sp.]